MILPYKCSLYSFEVKTTQSSLVKSLRLFYYFNSTQIGRGARTESAPTDFKDAVTYNKSFQYLSKRQQNKCFLNCIWEQFSVTFSRPVNLVFSWQPYYDICSGICGHHLILRTPRKQFGRTVHFPSFTAVEVGGKFYPSGYQA